MIISRAAMALLALLLATNPASGQAAETRSVERPDGSRVSYHLDRRDGSRRPVLLMLQGSGCDSVTTNDRIRWMAPRLAPRHALLTIEKYGVAPGADGETCEADYWRGNTLHRRVLDALLVVADLRRQRWWNGEIVLFGGSEGGAVAAMLAPLLPETEAAIVWSSGIGLPVGEMIRSVLPPPMQAESERVFAEARADPTGDRQWGGASYAWWADAIDLIPARSLAQTSAPVLLIHGTRDESAPVASARAAAALVRAGGHRHFEYREYEGYDHFMIDAAGTDHRGEVIAAASEWLRRLPRR
ncbi:MAG: alpha/beta hydrolase [Allosphingosinicella sp.]